MYTKIGGYFRDPFGEYKKSVEEMKKRNFGTGESVMSMKEIFLEKGEKKGEKKKRKRNRPADA